MKVAAVLVLALLAANSAVAGEGHVAQSKLNRLGLAGMQSMTDAEGTQIRGQSARAVLIGVPLFPASIGLVSTSTSAGFIRVPFASVSFASSNVSTTSAGFVRVPFGSVSFANSNIATISAPIGFVFFGR